MVGSIVKGLVEVVPYHSSPGTYFLSHVFKLPFYDTKTEKISKHYTYVILQWLFRTSILQKKPELCSKRFCWQIPLDKGTAMENCRVSSDLKVFYVESLTIYTKREEKILLMVKFFYIHSYMVVNLCPFFILILALRWRVRIGDTHKVT